MFNESSSFNVRSVKGEDEDFKKAIYYISRAIKFDPEFATSYYNLGLAYYHLSDYTSAKNIWEEYQKRMPDDPDGYQCLGEAASHLNDPAGAEAFFKKALGLNPKYEGALFSLGELYLAQGQLEVAADYVAQFQQLKPEDPEGYFLMACIQVKQQQDDKALMNLEQALNLGMKEVGRLNADQRLGQLRNTERFKSMKKKYFPGKS